MGELVRIQFQRLKFHRVWNAVPRQSRGGRKNRPREKIIIAGKKAPSHAECAVMRKMRRNPLPLLRNQPPPRKRLPPKRLPPNLPPNLDLKTEARRKILPELLRLNHVLVKKPKLRAV